MPLDPAFRSILDTLDAAGVLPIVGPDAVATRTRYRELALARRGPGFVPEPVASAEDSTVAGPGGDVPVRTYLPDGEPAAAVVYLHGGGWAVGDLDTHDPVCRRVTNATGAVVVSVDYRLAPEHPHPAAIDDATAALHAVAARWPGLPVGVAGDSAGASLSAGLAVRSRDGGGPDIAGQLLFYPAIDPARTYPSMTENGSGYFLTSGDMDHFWSWYLPGGAGADDPEIALLTADVRGVAPAVVATAEFDPLRDEGAAFAAHLERAGVPVRLVEGPGLIHGYAAFLGVVDAAERTAGTALAAFRDLLRA